MNRADVDDFLARIDEVIAPACGACAATLDPDGASLYFCDDECSDRWHRTQAEPLVGYREPWHRPDEFPGVGREQFRPNPETPESPETYGSHLASGLADLIAERDRMFTRWYDSIVQPRQSRRAQVFVTSTPDDPASGWRSIGRVSGTGLTFAVSDEVVDWSADCVPFTVNAEDCTLTLRTSSDVLPEDLRRLMEGEWVAPQIRTAQRQVTVEAIRDAAVDVVALVEEELVRELGAPRERCLFNWQVEQRRPGRPRPEWVGWDPRGPRPHRGYMAVCTAQTQHETDATST